MNALAKAGCMTVAVSCLFMFGCSSGPGQPSDSTRIANPASTYCVSKGGKVQIKKDSDGNEIGMCHLPGGTVIEEWKLFRRDHPQKKH